MFQKTISSFILTKNCHTRSSLCHKTLPVRSFVIEEWSTRPGNVTLYFTKCKDIDGKLMDPDKGAIIFSSRGHTSKIYSCVVNVFVPGPKIINKLIYSVRLLDGLISFFLFYRLSSFRFLFSAPNFFLVQMYGILLPVPKSMASNKSRKRPASERYSKRTRRISGI